MDSRASGGWLRPSLSGQQQAHARVGGNKCPKSKSQTSWNGVWSVKKTTVDSVVWRNSYIKTLTHRRTFDELYKAHFYLRWKRLSLWWDYSNCCKNAVAESLFGSLKQQRVWWQNYQTRYEVQQDVMNYLTMWYVPIWIRKWISDFVYTCIWCIN